MSTPINVLERDVVMERVETGLMLPIQEGHGLRVIDCGDDRGLTPDYYEQRINRLGAEISPGRYFGAASGIAVASLITFAAEHGDGAVANFVNNFSPEGFVDYASNLSDRAHKLEEAIDLNQHSDDTKEGNQVELANHKHCEDPLGCAFAIKLGAIVLGANQPWQMSEARDVLAAAGTDLPLTEAAEGVAIIQKYLPDNFGIHRGALHHAQTKKGLYTPIAMHEGHHAQSETTALVIDLAGFRSNANRHNREDLPRYHQTPRLASDMLPHLMPEIQLDPRLLQATGLLLGCSTRAALSGSSTPEALRIEVIPEEHAQVA